MALTMIEKACVAFGDTPLVAVSTPEKLPTVVGVPAMTPVIPFSASPGGKAACVTEYEGAGTPLALTA